MADCSYARCLQERRYIKRKLMKRSKDMLYIIGLERVAEESMGRRKWKQYQEALTRSHLSADITNLYQIDISNQKHEIEQKLEKLKENSHYQQQQPFENDVSRINTEVFDVRERNFHSPYIKKENFEDNTLVTEGSIKLNNYTNTSPNIHNNRKNNNNEEQLPSKSPTPPTPIDWTPNEKCNFCIDGKLLTVNEKGELVAESSPALSEADLANKPPGDTDSDSSESLDRPNVRANERKISTSRLRDSFSSNMTSLESVAALTTIQSISGLSGFQLNPNLLYNLTQHGNSATPTTSETSAAAISPSLKDSPSPSDLTGEQPLDLSSKPSPNSSVGGDARHVNRAKPRVTPCAGRRTYTDEELTSALQDIMSGRLGTRRAAVQYNIPRSTLRNKVYKISSKAKHGAPCNTMHHPTSLDDLADADDDKQDLSADEEDNSGDKMLGTTLTSHGSDNLACQFVDPNFVANIQKFCAEHKNLAHDLQQQHSLNDIPTIHNKSTQLMESHSKQKNPSPQPQLPQPSPQQASPISQNTWQNVLFQSLLFSRSLPLHPDALKLFTAILVEQDPNFVTPQLLMQLGQLAQQPQHSPQPTQQQQLQSHQQAQEQQQHMQANTAGHSSVISASAATTFQNRQPKSETPEIASSMNLNETLGDDPSVILKIPSYKPVAGSSNSSTSAAVAVAAAASLCNSKNSENLPSTSPKIPTALGTGTTAHHHLHLHQHHNPTVPSTNNIPGISPPLIRHTSDQSQSPPTLSLREVIASSISRTFQQANKDAAAASSTSPSASLSMDNNDQYKRPSISVIKNIGGTDTSRFATAPNILSSHHNSNHHHQQHHHHQHHSQNAANNNLAGGKGTRPKRGKYRNYDRDSLVEAVKAVQRGEMSVHRAGSYYGVPHSTLEYKVKERHLMRPRKREPKPQPPLDDRTGTSTSGGGSSSSSSTNTSKNSNIPGLSAVNSLDKLNKNSSTAGSSVNQKQCAANKNTPPFPTTSPNGMKIPPALFEPNLAAQLQYPPHILWSGGFGPFSMDFNSRSAAAAVAAAAGNPSFSNAELFKSQMMQRFHEERGPPNSINSPPVSTTTMNNSTSGNSTNHIKNVREITENFYDTGSANGSFLDGIIRKTLDRKSSDHALLDQLVKNSKPPPPRMMINNENATATGSDLLRLKRSGSPLHYNPAIEIKRERGSPSSDSSNSDSDRNAPRDTDSEPLPPPQPTLSSSSHLALGLHHALLAGHGGASNSSSNDLNGTKQQQPFTCQITTSENEIVASSSTSALSSSSIALTTSSILHEKLGQIKTETEDSL